jgi:hypothetical protein
MSALSLLSTEYKVTSFILLARLNMHVDEIIGDRRRSFWLNKSTADHIFCLYEIGEEKW